MNLQEQETFFNDWVAKKADVLLKKGNDYAGEDRLSNFKLVSDIVGITPEQVALVFSATKVVRLGQLLGGKEPNNESIEDSMLDGSNYFDLSAMLMWEKKEKTLCCGNWDDNGICKCK